MRRLLVTLALIITCALPLEAQSLLNKPDAWWESIQARNPWTYQLDNEHWKTWIWHGAFTVGGGAVIGALSPLSARQGRFVVAGIYVMREAINVFVEGSQSPTYDHFMDVAVPITLATIRF